MQCKYRCTEGWLVTHGGRDSIVEDDGSITLLLWPSEFTACFSCNEGSWINADIEEN